MIDKRGRLFGRINILDLLIILVLLLAGGKLAYDRLHVQQMIAPPKDDVLIEFKAYVPNPIGSNVLVGQKVHDKRTGVYIGTVTSVQIKPLATALMGQTGAAESEIRLLLANKATITEQVYQVGALGVRAGDVITLNGPQFSLSGYITSLSKGR